MADAIEQSGNAPSHKLPSGRRDAVIFIPGLADQDFGPDQTVDGVAGRISNACNIRATTAGAVFRTEVREQVYDLHDCYKARVGRSFAATDRKRREASTSCRITISPMGPSRNL